MFSAIKNKVSDFFLYMSESFSDMKERPWKVLVYAIVWPVLSVFYIFLGILSAFYIFVLILPDGEVKSSKTIYIHRDGDGM